MTRSLLPLSPAARDQLRMLYLASKAPEVGAPEPPMDPETGVHARYNYELFNVLREIGVTVTPCNDLARFPSLLEQHNYVFTIFNRWPMRNAEVYVPTVCEFHGVPYLGGPPNVRALAEDKYWTKQIARQLEVPVPLGRFYRDDLATPPDFPGPYLAKPRFGAASVGIEADAVKDTWAELRPYLEKQLDAGTEILVEQCIDGTDLTVPVLGGEAGPRLLPCAWEISELPHGLATFRQKRLLEKGRVRQMLPADHPLNDEIQRHALRMAELFQPFDYIRVDFRMSEDQKRVYLLEVNFCCNLGAHAAVAQSAAAEGISHADLITHILAYSLRRQRNTLC